MRCSFLFWWNFILFPTMVPTLSVLFVSSVFVFGLCRGKTVSEKLQEAIVLVEVELLIIDNKNHIVRQEVEVESNRCAGLINATNDIKSKRSEEARALQRALVEQYIQLMYSYAEEDKIRGNIRRYERVRLGDKLERENIDVLLRRRNSGTAQMCLELTGLKNDTKAPHKSLSSRASRLDDIESLSYVLEGKLRLLRIQLAEARYENRDLNKSLEFAKERCSKTINHLTNIVEKLDKDMELVRGAVKKTKLMVALQQSKVEDLRGLEGANRRDHEEWEQAAKKILDEYQEYSVDVKCYEMLHRGLVSARPRLSERPLKKANVTHTKHLSEASAT